MNDEQSQSSPQRLNEKFNIAAKKSTSYEHGDKFIKIAQQHSLNRNVELPSSITNERNRKRLLHHGVRGGSIVARIRRQIPALPSTFLTIRHLWTVLIT